MLPIKILSLRDCPQFADACAAWSYGEWGTQTNSRTLAEVLERYQKTASTKELPQTWVALSGDKPAGMISLKDSDHPDIYDLKPWLASLFVHPNFRRQGIAGQLMAHCEQEARNLKIDKLYLFTSHAEKLYAKSDWQKIRMIADPATDNPEGATLMMKAP